MLSTIIFFLLIITIYIYYYHHILQYHFWYHLGKNLGKEKFYSGKLHPNIYSKKDLKEQDKNCLVKLYKNYLKGVLIDKQKIEYFLEKMPHAEIFYMKVNSIYYGAIMNSIIEIKHKNKKYLSNFVDNAIINKNYRDNGIFKELMSYIADYSNKMNAKFVIFKIDRKPIPSFYEYNITSNYYYLSKPLKINSKKILNEVIELKNTRNMIILTCRNNEKQDNWENNANFFGITHFFKVDENLEVIPFKKGTTTMIFKRNSSECMELLYINNPEKESMITIVNYLFNNLIFDILFVDDIGNNSHLIKEFPNLFKIAYPVYHYILGLKEKIEKENFFYYF
jgi:hypothetical protein